MGLRAWAARCIPGFSILALSALIVLALIPPTTFSKLGSRRSTVYRPSADRKQEGASLLQCIFAVYNILIHILAVLAPLRFCWSLWDITGHIRSSAEHHASRNKPIDTIAKTRTTGFPTASLSPLDTSVRESSDLGDEHTEELSRETGGENYRADNCSMGIIRHAILLPNYKEDIDNLRETLDVLASHAQARSSYDIWLAMEEEDPNAQTTAAILLDGYSKFFHDVHYTLHPSGLTGEVQGKSSNISWAGRMAGRAYQGSKLGQEIVFTVMDADTHLSSNYFAELSRQHFAHSDTAQTTLYAVPIIFDRNAHKVPALIRLSDIVWCAAGLSGLYQGSTIVIPTSVYSIPLSLVELVGGWDTGAEAIGEDMHMYLKCYFALAGHLTVRVIYSPASQSNVDSDKRGIRGWVEGLRARYRQAMRHMWGCLDSGYACMQTGLLISGFRQGDDYIKAKPARSFSRCMPKFSFIMLAHRLFEAHFLTVHLFMLLLAGVVYQFITPPEQTPSFLLISLNIAGKLRAAAFFSMLCAFYLYEAYHMVCVRAREEEMRRARLYDRMRDDFTKSNKSSLTHWLQYLMFPVSGILFVTLPSVVAQLSHFRTDKLRYEVSKKPKVQLCETDKKIDV